MGGQHVQRRLADAVGRALGRLHALGALHAAQPARHVHDHAAGPDVRAQVLDQLGGAEHVDRDVLRQIVGADVQRVLLRGGVDARVVEEEVEPRGGAEGGGDVLGEGLQRGQRGGVALEDVDFGGLGGGNEGLQVREVAARGAHAREDGVGGGGASQLADEFEAEAAVGAGEGVGGHCGFGGVGVCLVVVWRRSWGMDVIG